MALRWIQIILFWKILILRFFWPKSKKWPKMAKKVLQLTQASNVWGPVKYCKIIFRGYFLFYSLVNHAKLSKKQIRVGKNKKKHFFDQKCQWGNCYNSRKKIINFSQNCQKKINLLTPEQKQGPNYDNSQRTWYL